MRRISLVLDRRRLFDIELSLGWFLSAAIVLLYCFYLISPAVSLYLTRDRNLRIGRSVEEIAFAIVLPALLLAAFRNGRLIVSKYHFWVMLFVAFGVLSTYLGEAPANVALLGFLQTTRPLIVFILFYSLVMGPNTADRILRWLDIFFTLLPILAVLYMLMLEMGLGFNLVPAVEEAVLSRLGIVAKRSFFVHPGHFGAMMVLAGVYQLSAYVVAGEKRRLVFLSVAAFGAFMTVRLRTMLVAPFCLLLIYLLHRLQGGKISRRSFLAGSMMLVIVVVVVLVLVTLTPMRGIIESRLSADSASVRTILFTSAIQLNFETYGLGVGYGRFGSPASAASYYSPLFERFGLDQLRNATPDNPSYLTDQWWSWYLGEIGIIGTSIFLFIIAQIVWSLYKKALYWQASHPALSVIAYTALGLLMYGVAVGFAGTFLTGSPATYFVMSLVGLTFAMHRAYINADNVDASESVAAR